MFILLPNRYLCISVAASPPVTKQFKSHTPPLNPLDDPKSLPLDLWSLCPPTWPPTRDQPSTPSTPRHRLPICGTRQG